VPLRALDENRTQIIAPLLDDYTWRALVTDVRQGNRTLRTVCCGHPARPRVSPLGTRHFYHVPAADRPICTHEAESPEHLAIKAGILAHAATRGIGAVPESPGEGFIADVLLSPASGLVAMEVQLSAQDTVTTLERTERYEAAGIRTVWLMRRRPPDLPRDSCAFEFITLEPAVLQVAASQVPLVELLDAVIDAQLAWRAATLALPINVEVLGLVGACWSCGGLQCAFVARAPMRCRCGLSLGDWDLRQPRVGELVLDAQSRALLRPAGVAAAIARVEPVQTGAASCCPHCGAISDPDRLRVELNRAMGRRAHVPVAASLRLTGAEPLEGDLHWCLAADTID
jgi:hypothetical protein